MPRSPRRLVVLHASWFLIVLTLLAVVERRAATYFHSLDVEVAFADADSVWGERVVKALLAAHDARPPELDLFGPRELSQQEHSIPLFLVTPRASSPRAPPLIGGSQRST